MLKNKAKKPHPQTSTIKGDNMIRSKLKQSGKFQPERECRMNQAQGPKGAVYAAEPPPP